MNRILIFIPSFSQVKKNVESWQFERYVKSQGINPETLTDEQKNNLKLDMTKDLYPGERIVITYHMSNIHNIYCYPTYFLRSG